MANVSAFSGAMPVIPGGLVELGYVERTTSQSITATTFAGASEVFATDLTFVADGGPVLVEFYCPQVSVGGGYIVINLSNGGSTDMGQISYNGTSTAVNTQYRYTPAAGSQTLNVRAWVQSGTGTVSSGAGGSGQYPPTFLRVSKIVNQNDGLKPFWTPPVVTQLPSQATVGDQVIYAADATNGVYWQLQYDGLGTYPWKFIGGPALVSTADGSGTTTSTTYTTSLTGASNAGPSLTIALPGDYDVAYGAGQVGQNTNDKVAYMAVGTGTPGSSIDWVRIYTWATSNATYFNRVDVSMHASRRLTGLAGASTLAAYYKVNTGATATFGDRYMNVTPVRVKAA